MHSLPHKPIAPSPSRRPSSQGQGGRVPSCNFMPSLTSPECSFPPSHGNSRVTSSPRSSSQHAPSHSARSSNLHTLGMPSTLFSWPRCKGRLWNPGEMDSSNAPIRKGFALQVGCIFINDPKRQTVPHMLTSGSESETHMPRLGTFPFQCSFTHPKVNLPSPTALDLLHIPTMPGIQVDIAFVFQILFFVVSLPQF